jgi:predicted ribosomally synthesized peptide with SipW-like signal peptide
MKGKSPFLALIVVIAIVAAGLGGTLAHFSDTEESMDNYIQVGAMDLKVVHYSSETMWDDPNVPTLVNIELETLESIDRTWRLRNIGQPADDPCHVYMRIKELECYNILAQQFGYADPEPEQVTEFGGRHGQVDLPGIGVLGDDCTLGDFIRVNILFGVDPTQADPTHPDAMQLVYAGYLSGIADTDLLLGDLDKGETKYVDIDFRIFNIDEDDFLDFFEVDNDGDGDVDEDGRTDGFDGLPGVDDDGDGYVDEDPGYEGDGSTDDGGYFNGLDPDTALKCWDKWPTNALMKDKVTFKMLFALVEGEAPEDENGNGD